MTRRVASITQLGFKCFRLVAIYGHDPGEPPFQPVMLSRTTTRMRAFTSR